MGKGERRERRAAEGTYEWRGAPCCTQVGEVIIEMPAMFVSIALVFFQTVRDEKVEQKEEEKGGEGVQIEGPF